MGRKPSATSPESSVPDAPLGRLLLQPPTLSADDEIATAAAVLRDSGSPTIPVFRAGHLLGCITERELLAGMGARAGNGEPARCRDYARPLTPIPLATPLDEAVWLLQRDGIDHLAVHDGDGKYLGILTRARLMQHFDEQRRPRLVGGMATPFGVYLTSLHHRGGAGDVALFCTGLLLSLQATLALVIVGLGLALASPDAFQAALGFLSFGLVAAGAVPAMPPLLLVHVLVFLLLLRLSPLAGYHSGEHQVVHALERGLPLTVDAVTPMPRPHVRCGTNLVVWLYALLLVGLIVDGSGRWQQLWALPAVAALLFWRPVGLWIQLHFTTKPASRRQMEAGIRAGRMLLARYQRAPEWRAGWLRRVWNRGLVQVVAGMAAGGWLIGQLAALVGWAAMPR